MKLRDVVSINPGGFLKEMYTCDSQILVEHVFSVIDEIEQRLKDHGTEDVESIKILAGLLLFVHLNQGSSGVVGVNALLHDDPHTGESFGSIKKLEKHYPEEFSKNISEIKVAIKKKALYSVIRVVRSFFERRSEPNDDNRI